MSKTKLVCLSVCIEGGDDDQENESDDDDDDFDWEVEQHLPEVNQVHIIIIFSFLVLTFLGSNNAFHIHGKFY